MRGSLFAAALVVASPIAMAQADGTLEQEVEMLQQQVKMLTQALDSVQAQLKTRDAAVDEKIAKVEKKSGLLGVNTAYSKRMLNWQENVTGKVVEQLKARQSGELEKDKVYVSGMFKASLMAETTNKSGKFPILSRFPNQHKGKSGSRFVVNNAALGITSTFGDWTTVYLQPEYTEIEFSSSQDEFQMRKAYVTLGNLDKSPFYAVIGRKTIDFGNFDSYNPFTHSVGTHFFWAQSDGPVASVGYYKDGLNIVGTAINGGRHLRTADSDDSSTISNFAINASKTFALDDGSITVGGGYLHNSIYRSNFPNHPGVGSVSPPFPVFLEERNGIWDVYSELLVGSFGLMVEFTSTENDWLATGRKVQAITAQGKYNTHLFDRPATLSAVYGRGNFGPGNTDFDFAQQVVLGAEVQYNDYLNVGVEYVYNEGFQPLLDITQVSDTDVEAHTLIGGIRSWF